MIKPSNGITIVLTGLFSPSGKPSHCLPINGYTVLITNKEISRKILKKTRVAKLTGLTSFRVQLNKSQFVGESDVVRGDCVEVS